MVETYRDLNCSGASPNFLHVTLFPIAQKSELFAMGPVQFC